MFTTISVFKTKVLQRSLFKLQTCNFSAYKPSSVDVKRLREMTGSPLMDCMKALTESTGDFEKSKEFLRKRGLAYAEKRADKLATQGLIGLHSDSNSVTMV